MPTIKQYTTWKFEEADDDLKEKIYDRYRTFNVEDDWWYDYDCKTGFSSGEFERMGIEIGAPNTDDLLSYKKLYFSIDREWYIQFVDAEFVDEDIARKFLKIPKEIWDMANIKIDDCPSRERNTKLEYDFEGYEYNEDYDGYSDEEILELNRKAEQILDDAVEIFDDKMEEALKDLRSVYEYQCSDEAIANTMIANDYDFNEHGKIS